MVARVIAIESLVLIEKISFSQETAVDVAVFEVEGGLPVVLDVADGLAGTFAEGAVED